MQERQTRVRSAARALPKPDEILALARQRYDSAAGRLIQGLKANTRFHRGRLSEIVPRLTLKSLSITIANDRKILKSC